MQHRKIMQKSFYVNLGLVIIKILSGIFFSSVALIADGVHSISDLLSDVFVILGIRHSERPADDDHPFGHGKFEYVLSLFLGLSVMFIAYNLLMSVINQFNDDSIVPSSFSLIVIIVVVIAKLILSRYLIRKGKELNSEIISASGQESFSDVISSAVVFVGIVSVILSDTLNIEFLKKGDKIASIIIALFILRIGVMIIFQAVVSLQGRSVKEDISNEYRDIIENVPGVIEVDKLEMIAYGPYYQAIVDIKVDGNITVTEGHDIAHEVEELMKLQEKICHISVHVNPEV